MSEEASIAADYRRGIAAVTVELYCSDTKQNRRRVYREFEKSERYRLRGVFKTGEREVSCIPSIVKADLVRRALGSNPAASSQP